MIATCTHVHRTGRASPFRECEDKTRESRRTPQTETADPGRGCISHLKFPLWFTMKVQHCESRGTHCKCRPRVQWLHQCEVMSFCSCGCFPRMRSIWFRERGQDLWTMSKRSRGELQLSISRPEGCANPEVCTAPSVYSSGCTMSVHHCKSHGVLNKKRGLRE